MNKAQAIKLITSFRTSNRGDAEADAWRSIMRLETTCHHRTLQALQKYYGCSVNTVALALAPSGHKMQRHHHLNAFHQVRHAFRGGRAVIGWGYVHALAGSDVAGSDAPAPVLFLALLTANRWPVTSMTFPEGTCLDEDGYACDIKGALAYWTQLATDYDAEERQRDAKRHHDADRDCWANCILCAEGVAATGRRERLADPPKPPVPSVPAERAADLPTDPQATVVGYLDGNGGTVSELEAKVRVYLAAIRDTAKLVELAAEMVLDAGPTTCAGEEHMQKVFLTTEMLDDLVWKFGEGVDE